MASQQPAGPVTAGLPPQSSIRTLPPTAQLPNPAQFPPGMSAGHPRGIVPPSHGPMYQMPPVPGGGSQRPAGAVPVQPAGAYQLPTTGPSVSTSHGETEKH